MEVRLEGWDAVGIEAPCRPFKYYWIKKNYLLIFRLHWVFVILRVFLFSESQGYSPVAVCRLLTVVASHVAPWLLWFKGVKASVFAVSRL